MTSEPSPDPRAPFVASLAVRASDAYLWMALASALEALVFGLVRRRDLVGWLEVALATRTLLTLALVALFPLALAAGFVLELASRTGPIRSVVETRRRRATAATALAGAGVVLLALAARTTRTADLVSAETLVGRAGLELPPAPALAALACASALALLRPRTPPLPPTGTLRGVTALVLAALAASAAGPAAHALSRLDNVRRVYAGAPTLRSALAVGARIVPPARLTDTAERKPAPGALDLLGRDVLLVTIGAARADHAGAYGYGRRTTPALDRLAETGVVFERAYTPAPDGPFALASLFTGKYLRPLVRLGLGQGSETLPGLLQRYGVETAAFYPEGALAGEAEGLSRLREARLGFAYAEVDRGGATARAEAVKRWLAKGSGAARFVWVHLDEPNHPYVEHPEHPFGPREIDRYDSELATADAALSSMVEALRVARPGALVIVTADHGEEFGEHGGHYHGTSVYEEQVRVPLVWSLPGQPARRVQTPVSLVDVAPTLLAGLGIPRPARLRGVDLSAIATKGDAAIEPRGTGAREHFAYAEANEHALFARGSERLVCARSAGTCALYDVAGDPLQTRDVSKERPESVNALREELRRFEGSHGRYEAEKRQDVGLPEALRRAIGGDGNAALEVSALLQGGDLAVRRRAAEVLFDLKRPETAAALRTALLQSDDAVVRDWSSLTLARLGEGAPRARDLLVGGDLELRRLAALAMCEAGEDRGQDELAAWLRAGFPKPSEVDAMLPAPGSGLGLERAREVLRALGKVRSKRSAPAVLRVLDEPRLRPLAAEVLGQIGERFARPALEERLWVERQVPTRVALAKALLALGGREELRGPLVRWMGTPEPMPGSLDLAMKIGMLELVGGPRESDRLRLARFATSGVVLPVIIPKVKEPSDLPAPPHLPGGRILCRVRTKDQRAGELRVGASAKPLALGKNEFLVPHAKPELDPKRSAVLQVPASKELIEVHTPLPDGLSTKPGVGLVLVAYATQNVVVVACAVVPVRGELR